MPTNSQLVEILREREFELFDARRSLQELSEKFSQLENAFAVNLRVQSELEDDLEVCKLDEKSSIKKNNSHDQSRDKNWKNQTELYSCLTMARVEKQRWKEAFFHQKSITEKRKLEHEKSIDTIRDECENILKNCRQTGEKYFRELLKICDDSREQAKFLEKSSKASQARESWTAERILELANVLETLEKFDGVRIEVLCRCAAKALRSLANNKEETRIEGMRELRQLNQDMKENDKNLDSLEYLQAQNSVLRQVVKSLKRKDKISEHRENFPSEIKENKNSDGNSDGNLVPGENNEEEKCEKSEEKLCNNETNNSIVTIVKEDRKLTINNGKKSTKNKEKIEKNDVEKYYEKNNSQYNDRIENRLYIDSLESHKNGIPYAEYNFHFFDGRKFRIKHSNYRKKENSTLLIEFVNTEKAFYEAPIDRTIFYLGDNVREIVNLKKTKVHCSVQTKRLKFCEKFVQTTITGTNGFSRVNAGIGMLNSEKRSIERSLRNLEMTVASLQENTLGQACSIIRKDAMNLGKEFFDCVERLER